MVAVRWAWHEPDHHMITKGKVIWYPKWSEKCVEFKYGVGFVTYVMNVMTFGFANAPVYFQWWMSKVLKPVAGLNVVNYLDDTRTFNNNLPEHIQTNLAVLNCFNNHGVFLNLNKCLFHQSEMDFLGVDVLDKGFEMERPKLEAIEEWKPPMNVQGVREFVGFCNFYCCFIKSFSEIANCMPITQPHEGWTTVDMGWKRTIHIWDAQENCYRSTSAHPCNPDKKF